MQPISFFDDGPDFGKDRSDVRLKNLGVYVYEDGRRVAVGFELTPFRERPSLEIVATNARGERAGSMTVIEALSPNFSLTLHLRDREPASDYELEAVVYYRDEGDEGRMVVDRKRVVFDASQPGDQTIWEEEE
ncbi:MAG: hypothetical protein RRC07_05300 [Anaerolineae bacterium]|nr:hypothetical protein [Anaerolineae bacterium]